MNCFHCGEKMIGSPIVYDDKQFCCHGCQSVYMLLEENKMCSFYDNPERKLSKAPAVEKFAFLDNPQIAEQYLQFSSPQRSVVQFKSPYIQCASCVFLLERMHLLQAGVIESRVQFSQQSFTIHFNPELTTLRQLVEWLTYIGYEPMLDHEKADQSLWHKMQKEYWIAIAISGFCFANIMLLSFPEYLNLDMEDAEGITLLFRILNVILGTFALGFGAKTFFIKTLQGLRAKTLPIDAPLVLSLLLTYTRSLYEVISSTGGGYFDSMTGIIFFMLIGRYIQEATQQKLHFQRTYKSFFPISSLRINDNIEEWISLSEIAVGDTIRIHSYELIPCDGILLSDHALIDYSFVTGESRPQAVQKGDKLFAGGKQLGSECSMQTTAKVEHSYLINLWNYKTTDKKSAELSWVDHWAQHFTLFLMALTLGAFIYWFNIDPARGLHAATTILIVACPCALLLSATFTHGAVLYQLSKIGCHVKNASVLDTLADADAIAWDKTGTLTTKDVQVNWVQRPIDDHLNAIHHLTRQSTHPISQALYKNTKNYAPKNIQLSQYKETIGKGIEGFIENRHYKIGSAEWLGQSQDQHVNTFISIDGDIIGAIALHHPIRKGIKQVLSNLQNVFRQSIISGDPLPYSNEILDIIPEGCHPFHGLSPEQKRNHIAQWKEQGRNVIMIGDGLNDAGALSEANIGIAITEDAFGFSPSCHIILEAKQLHILPKIIQYARDQKKIVQWSFGISLLYNTIGLSIAVQGIMHPLIAAVLMPASSITIMAFTSAMAVWKRPK